MPTTDESDVIIITKDRPQALPYAIKQITSKIPYHKIIIVDGSQNPPPIKDDFPEVDVINLPNAKLGHARQTGLKKATTPLVINFDDDIWYPPEWYENMINFIKTEPENVAAISSRLIRAPTLTHPLAKLYLTVNNHRRKGHSGGCVMLDRRKILKVGGWNPYIHRGEDLELSQRLERHGYTWIRNGEAYAFHPSPFHEIARGMIPNGKAGIHGIYNQNPIYLLLRHIASTTFQPLRMALTAHDPQIIPHYTWIRLLQLYGFMQGVEEYRRKGTIMEASSKYQ